MSNYWDKKEKLKIDADRHTYECGIKYEKEIKIAVRESRIFGPELRPEPRLLIVGTPDVVFMNTDTVSALFAEAKGRTGVLNFASYKNPGGKFTEGSSAQEEMLCHESILYNVLREQTTYYAWNNEHKNKALYLDRAIVTPNVIFTREGKRKKADVITCAAPNYKAAHRYMGVSKEENSECLKKRIEFIRTVAEECYMGCLILGAYGCGVFGQDPEEVAKLFSETFAKTSIRKLVYAVPGNDRNAQIFQKFFS